MVSFVSVFALVAGALGGFNPERTRLVDRGSVGVLVRGNEPVTTSTGFSPQVDSSSSSVLIDSRKHRRSPVTIDGARAGEAFAWDALSESIRNVTGVAGDLFVVDISLITINNDKDLSTERQSTFSFIYYGVCVSKASVAFSPLS